MPKISMLPELAEPTGNETVAVLKNGVVRRSLLGRLVSAATAPIAALANAAKGDAESAARTASFALDAAVDALAGANIYASRAEAIAALGTLPNDALVTVLEDVDHFGARTLYRIAGGALAYQSTMALPTTFAGSSDKMRRPGRGSVLCLVGDSNTQRPGWRNAYSKVWLTDGGIFDGWTCWNAGANGATALYWAQQIDTGDRSAVPHDNQPADVATANPWQIVNAAPHHIIIRLMTNDFRDLGGQTLAARKSAVAAALGRLVALFLTRTAATIEIQIPQPIAWLEGHPSTTCTSAADAAARSIAMREVALGWENVSPRVEVLDTHAHLFGYRVNSIVDDGQDPEGQGALYDAGDPLHLSYLGYARLAQLKERKVDPSIAKRMAYCDVPASIAKSAYWAKTIRVAESGNNYIRVASNPQVKAGTIPLGAGDAYRGDLSPSRARAAADMLAMAGALTDIREMQSMSAAYLYFHETGATVGPFAFGTGADRPLNGYWEFQPGGTDFGGNTGLATLYALSARTTPHFLPASLPIRIDLNGPQPLGIGAIGMVKPAQEFVEYRIGHVEGARASGGNGCVIEVYYATGAGGNQGAGGFPGQRLGTLTFPDGGWKNTQDAGQWAFDPAAFPLAGLNGYTISLGTNVVLSAQCVAGDLGACASITIMPA